MATTSTAKKAPKKAAPKKSTAKKTTAAKKTAPKASHKRTAAQLRKEAAAKATHAAQLDADAAKSRIEKNAEVAREYVQTAVDVPVGVVLNAADRVSELVEPWTDQNSAEKKVKSYRADLTKTFKRAERRGTSTRKKVTTRAKRTRNSLEKQVRKQQKTAEKQIKTTNKEVSRTIEARVDAVSKQATKVQTDGTKQAEVQGKKAQEFVNKVTEQLTALV